MAIAMILCLDAEVVDQEDAMDHTGPIFLEQLFCTEVDVSLLDCQSGMRAPGLTKCDHSEDVWIRCRGKLEILRFDLHQLSGLLRIFVII